MKTHFKSIIPAAILAARVNCQAQVYSQGIYSMGTAYFGVSSTTLPFAPYQYDLTEITWSEDSNGYTINPITHKTAPGDVSRLCLEVVSGSEDFFMPLDSGPVKTFKSKADSPIVKGSGDFVPVLTRCLTNRGGRTTTNALPVIQANWTCGTQANEDIFVLTGDYFVQVQKLLEQACGKPDGAIHSSAPEGGNCCSINYTPGQVGVFLNLTRGLDNRTIVSVVEKQKP